MPIAQLMKCNPSASIYSCKDEGLFTTESLPISRSTRRSHRLFVKLNDGPNNPSVPFVTRQKPLIQLFVIHRDGNKKLS